MFLSIVKHFSVSVKLIPWKVYCRFVNIISYQTLQTPTYWLPTLSSSRPHFPTVYALQSISRLFFLHTFYVYETHLYEYLTKKFFLNRNYGQFVVCVLRCTVPPIMQAIPIPLAFINLSLISVLKKLILRCVKLVTACSTCQLNITKIQSKVFISMQICKYIFITKKAFIHWGSLYFPVCPFSSSFPEFNDM